MTFKGWLRSEKCLCLGCWSQISFGSKSTSSWASQRHKENNTCVKLPWSKDTGVLHLPKDLWWVKRSLPWRTNEKDCSALWCARKSMRIKQWASIWATLPCSFARIETWKATSIARSATSLRTSTLRRQSWNSKRVKIFAWRIGSTIWRHASGAT